MTHQITLPQNSYRRVQQLAKRLQTTPTDIIVKMIDEQIDSYPTVHVPDEQEILLREMGAFDEMKPSLIEEYLGQYVAITDGKLIDSDAHRRTLIRRVRPQYPDQFVLFRLVEEKQQPDLHFRGWSFG